MKSTTNVFFTQHQNNSAHTGLTHWGWVTHICISNFAIIGSDNGLSPGLRQAIIWTKAEILLIGPLGTNFSEILIQIHTFSFKKIYLKLLSAKFVSAILSWPQCVNAMEANGSVQSSTMVPTVKTNFWFLDFLQCDVGSTSNWELILAWILSWDVRPTSIVRRLLCYRLLAAIRVYISDGRADPNASPLLTPQQLFQLARPIPLAIVN